MRNVMKKNIFSKLIVALAKEAPQNKLAVFFFAEKCGGFKFFSYLCEQKHPKPALCTNSH